MYFTFWAVWAARQGINDIIFNFAFDGFFHTFKQIQNVPSKGQLNSEWIYEVIVFSKIPTKNYRDFCPTF